MSDRRHLIIIVSILFVALVCVGSVGVASLLYRRAAMEGSELTTPAASAAIGRAQGIIVSSVEPNSPAARANIQPESLLVGVDTFPLDVPEDLVRYLESYNGSGTVVLTVRQGEVLTQLPVTLDPGSRRLGVEVRAINSPPPGASATVAPDLVLPTLTPPPAPPVIAIVMPDGAGAAAGLQVGDVVTAVDGRAILSNEELVTTIAGRGVGTAVQLTVRRGPDTLTIPVTLGAHPDDPTRGFIGIELADN